MSRVWEDEPVEWPHPFGKAPSVATYTNRGCRCDGCKAAQATYMRDYRKRKRQREYYRLGR